jgi:hypothetical protein
MEPTPFSLQWLVTEDSVEFVGGYTRYPKYSLFYNAEDSRANIVVDFDSTLVFNQWVNPGLEHFLTVEELLPIIYGK